MSMSTVLGQEGGSGGREEERGKKTDKKNECCARARARLHAQKTGWLASLRKKISYCKKMKAQKAALMPRRSAPAKFLDAQPRGQKSLREICRSRTGYSTHTHTSSLAVLTPLLTKFSFLEFFGTDWCCYDYEDRDLRALTRSLTYITLQIPLVAS